MFRVPFLASAAMVAVALAGNTAGAAAATSATTEALSAFRAEHGLPADMQENPWLTGACPWMTANSRPTGVLHVNAGSPLRGWLSDADDWTTGGQRPTVGRPIADSLLTDPSLAHVGLGPGCLILGKAGRLPPATATLEVFPGPDTTGIPPKVTATDEVGVGNLSEALGGPGTTGPYLRVFAWGGALTDVDPEGVVVPVGVSPWGPAGPGILTGELRGPEGVVPVLAVADGLTDEATILPTGVLIPLEPLSPDTWYEASATYRSETGATASRTWRFQTGTTEILPPAPGGGEDVDYAGEDGREISIPASPRPSEVQGPEPAASGRPAPAAAPNIAVRAQRVGRNRTRFVTRGPSTRPGLTVKLRVTGVYRSRRVAVLARPLTVTVQLQRGTARKTVTLPALARRGGKLRVVLESAAGGGFAASSRTVALSVAGAK